jgi:hypothetical protein
VKLWRHSNDHVIEVGIEVSSFWDIMSEGRVVVEPSHDIVGIVNESWGVGIHFGKIRRPDSLIGTFSLMNSEVRRPHSVMDNSLSEVPFLEEVSLVLLVSWVKLRKEDHFVNKFSLLETLIHQEIVLLMNSAMATLASPLKYLKTSPQSKDEQLELAE